MDGAVKRLAVALVLISLPAAAQHDPQAVELFQQSVEHYNEGRFEVAAALLREALERQPGEPTLQYNLARALEGHGDLDGAIATYESLLEHDELEDRGAIEQRVQTLREQRDAARELEALRNQRDQTPDRVEDEVEEGVEEDGPAEPPRRASPAPWIVAGLGVANLAVGAAFGALAVSDNNDARQEPIHERAAQLRDDAETKQLIANISFVVGGVLAGVGLVWGIVDVRKTRVEVSPTVGGVSVRGRF